MLFFNYLKNNLSVTNTIIYMLLELVKKIFLVFKICNSLLLNNAKLIAIINCLFFRYNLQNVGKVQKYKTKTSEQLEILNKWFITHITNPFPDRSTKLDLAYKTGLTYRQVSQWFNYQNKKLTRK